jgi:RNase H-like domain found in reverse transcriptase/Reverse transcriptase (RNA-dependent DNA polymerase)/Integrase zinc binding domain/gag-polyprotein putative aspartyl protease/Chromo (CHRromatin Organisation MOdifier) domain
MGEQEDGQERVQTVGHTLAGAQRSVAPCTRTIPRSSIGTTTQVYPPGLASQAQPRAYDDQAPPEIKTVQAAVEETSARLTPLAVRQLEHKLQIEFTLIVTDFTVLVNPCPDQYNYITVSEFLRCDTLKHAVVLFCIDPGRIQQVAQHCKEVPGPAMHSRRAYFVISDAHKDPLIGLQCPVEHYVFPAHEKIWQFTDTYGKCVALPTTTDSVRVYSEDPKNHSVLNALVSDDLLVVKAGIHQASVRLLLDTGASACFMSAKLAAALDLPIVPDKQDLMVTMAGGQMASITGSVIVPVCVGRYRAKIEFLIIDLAQDFDAILGYTWLRRHCDLHLSKNVLAFRDGNKVTCYRIPTGGSMTGSRSRIIPNLTGTCEPRSLRTEGRQTPRRKGDVTTGQTSDGRHLLSAIQLNKMLRKGGEGFLIYLSTAVHMAASGPDALSGHLDRLLDEYQDVFQDPPGLPPVRPIAHVAPLVPGSRPPYRRNYRMTEDERAELKKQLTELLAKGLIRPSVSPFGSPVIFVRKPNGEMRLCIDYRAVNKLTVKNRYPLPRIDDLLDQLRGATCFSSLDLKAGYNQIRIREEDIPATAITTPYGHWEYLVLPQGLANSPSLFVALMNDVFKGMEEYVLVYLDDILVFSRSQAEHATHLEKVLNRLREHQLYAKRSKCAFGKDRLKFLGHILSAEGLQVDPEKISALTEWPTPGNVTEVRQFMGLANYFRKFAQGFSSIARPLTDLTKAKTTWIWGAAQQAAFDNIKAVLTNAPTLQMPDSQLDYTVVCDASDFGIGAVLMQEEHPVAYFSKLLNAAQRNYTVTERELLAVVEALKLWRCYLGDQPFLVVTDHSPLTHFSTKKDLMGRQARWAETLAMYNFQWEYRPGRTNVADPFSRNPSLQRQLLAAVPTVRRKSTRLAKAPDSEPLSAQAETGTSLDPPAARDPWKTPVVLTAMEASISKAYAYDPCFAGNNAQNAKWEFRHKLWFDSEGKVVVPQHGDLRQRLVAAHHATPFSGHQGRERTLELVRRNYSWKGIAKDVAEYVATCHECQINKPRVNKPHGKLVPLQIPERPWSDITVDFVTGLPPTGEMKFDTITVFVDRMTKMVHYVPCREKLSAKDFADLFLTNIFRLHGLPQRIVSDRDPRFTSDFWKEVTQALQMDCGLSTAFHPQTDGQTERMNRTMEEMLRHYITPMLGDWVSALPLLEFAYNNAENASTQTSPFRLYTGLNPLCPNSGPADRAYKVPAAELFVNKMAADLKRAKQCMLDAQTRMKAQADKRRKDMVFKVGDLVLLSTKNLTLKSGGPRKLMPRYIGPFPVQALVGKVAYRLTLPDHMRIHNVFHVNLLHAYKADGKRHPPIPELIDGELEYRVDSITAHRERSIGGSKGRQPQRVKVEFLTCWAGYGREHDSWEPGEMLEDNEALDAYLKRLLARNEALPTGFYPEADDLPTPDKRRKQPATHSNRDVEVQGTATEPVEAKATSVSAGSSRTKRKRVKAKRKEAGKQPPPPAAHTPPVPEVVQEAQPMDIDDPPPAAALMPYKRRRVRFQLT